MVVLVGVEEVGGEGSARLAARFEIEALRNPVHQGAEKTDASLALRDFCGEVTESSTTVLTSADLSGESVAYANHLQLR